MRPVRITAYSWALGDGNPRSPPRLALEITAEKWQWKSLTKKNHRFQETGLSAARPTRKSASTATDLSKSDNPAARELPVANVSRGSGLRRASRGLQREFCGRTTES